MGHRAQLMGAASLRRALLLITLLSIWMGTTGTASAHMLQAEGRTGRADAATTEARHVYDVCLPYWDHVNPPVRIGP